VHKATLLGHRSVFFTQCEPEASEPSPIASFGAFGDLVF
jgi:hypothetical protein